jgi:hypothetical protein
MNRQAKIEEIQKLVSEASTFQMRIYIQAQKNGERIFYKSAPSDRNLKITVTSPESAEKYINFITHLQL